MSLELVIGNKNYSSWSLRGWLLVELSGAAYQETLVPLFRADTHARLLEHSPTAKVPVLKWDAGVIWDSLAIAEYLAERFPEAAMWPRDVAARAMARSVCAEMHSGFGALRSHMPMDMQRNAPLASVTDDVKHDIQRIVAIWTGCRERFGQGGPYLFGEVSIADAYFAPVASRLRSYGVQLPAEAAAYVETIFQWPAFQRWLQAALKE
ncbi:glutathione S-transferase family protein [Pseudomonas argentinensis]|uniref:Glutathione S-transferase n=1 Tax=Phytopseudomonas argentinensis TaxID=289370 RepID=A0A1I3HN78_9GAMM|nr:glutathione S-transferase family protein [Pseudomonas argentinensis]KAB0548268.1 glutathione S-transferase family protein [Pseudomonas argentinensis]SFI37141.1 glutathione S-transferase [Pseudomonas argentinensis]